MAFIALTEDTGETAANYTRAFAHRPAVLAAWRQLVGAITESMDERPYRLVTLAAAGSLRSSYCSLAHGSVLLERHLSADDLVAFATDPASAPLTPVEAAAVRLARDALGVQPDAKYAALAPELQEALVKGRPIAPPTVRDHEPATTG